MPSNCLHLAFQTDQNYVDGLVATLCGVATRLPTGTRAEVHVIDCGIEAETRRRLAALFATRFKNLALSFLELDASVLARLPFPEGLKHANRSVYARLFLPRLLPAVDRILYLDCDLLVDADISELAATPLGDAIIAAAVDEEMKSSTAATEFNSGVMVMNLQAMRDVGLTRRVESGAAKYNTKHGDQTLLNDFLRGQWFPLARRWNHQVFLLPEFSVFRDEPDTLWHVYMGRKPWHFHRVGARGLVADYYAALDSAGWAPTFTSRVSMQTSLPRDLLKASRAALRRKHRRAA